MGLDLHFSVSSTFKGTPCWVPLGVTGYKLEPIKCLEFMRTASHEYFTAEDMAIYEQLWANLDAADKAGNQDLAQAWHRAYTAHPLHRFDDPSAYLFFEWLQSNGYMTHEQIKAMADACGTKDKRIIRLACAWLGYDLGAANMVEELHFV